MNTNPGGDTVQVKNTAGFLREAGVDVDIRLANETIDYSSYDLLHLFNIIRPADLLNHIARSGKPYLISTIYVDYSEYDRLVRGGIAGLLFKTLPAGLIEYVKVVARMLLAGEKVNSPAYFFLGHRQSVKKVLKKAAMLLPNSQNEYNRLLKDFGVAKPYKVIPNAIDANLFMSRESISRESTVLLCVGRIEGLKNQLNLVRAVNNSKYQLYIIGAPASNQLAYYQQCVREAGPNIHFVDRLEQEQLLQYYARAAVHILPSWFETTGLSSLEAAAMGCQLVITAKGDTREYFEDMAWYCDPSSPESIIRAIEQAASSPVNPALRRKILEQYSWKETAAKTLEAYREILNVEC